MFPAVFLPSHPRGLYHISICIELSCTVYMAIKGQVMGNLMLILISLFPTATAATAAVCAGPTDCNLLGDCARSQCVCDSGFTGPRCEQLDLGPADPVGALRLPGNVSSWGGNVIKINGTYHLCVCPSLPPTYHLPHLCSPPPTSHLTPPTYRLPHHYHPLSDSLYPCPNTPGPLADASNVGPCGLHAFKVYSRVIHATSAAAAGPYTYRDTVADTVAHNAYPVRGPDGQLLVSWVVGLNLDGPLRSMQSLRPTLFTRVRYGRAVHPAPACAELGTARSRTCAVRSTHRTPLATVHVNSPWWCTQ